MKQTTYLVMLLILVMQVVALEEVYEFDVTFVKHPVFEEVDWISINHVRMISDIFTKDAVVDETKPAVYIFELVSEDNETIAKEYFIFSFFQVGIPEPVISSSINRKLNLPYFSDAKYLVISSQEEELLRYEIPSLCNNDGICDANENYYSCENDCTSFASDGACVEAGDGACDPDCFEEFDPDCTRVEEKSHLWLWILLMFLIIAVVIGGFFVVKKMKKPSELQNYVNSMLQKGYLKEQIRATLTNSGYSKEEIEKALR